MEPAPRSRARRAAAARRAPRATRPRRRSWSRDILADRESRSATFGLENPLATRFWSAVKTGTSKDMRDNWCVGFSRRYTVGVWVGNFSGEPMRDVSGVTGAAPVWLEVMAWLHRRGAERAAGRARRGRSRRAVAVPGAVEPRGRVVPRRHRAGRGDAAPAPAASRGSSRRSAGTIIALDPDIPAGPRAARLRGDGRA